MIRAIRGDNRVIGQYLSSRFPELTRDSLYEPHASIALIDDDGYLRGGIAVRLLNAFDASLSVAIDDWRSFPPRPVLKELFSAVFCGKKPLQRVSATIPRSNKRARMMAEKLGFKLEGVKRRGYDGRQAGCIYGMLREECRWIDGDLDGRARGT